MMKNLADKFDSILEEQEDCKNQLAAKLLPFIEQFMVDTGLRIDYVRVGYLEITTIGEDRRKFMVKNIHIETNQEVAGESDHIGVSNHVG